MQRRIAVIGAGAVGLSTAVQIQQLSASLSVTLIADKFTSETTSYGAAGIFRPSVNKFPGMPVSQLKSVAQCYRSVDIFIKLNQNQSLLSECYFMVQS